MYLRPELVNMERLVGAGAPDAPDATHTLAEMNAPGPLHGTLGMNPARYARRSLGKETVDKIVEHLASWVQEQLAEIAP